MTDHERDISEASAALMKALFLLLGTTKRFGFDQQPDADAVRRAYDATADALNALVRK